MLNIGSLGDNVEGFFGSMEPLSIGGFGLLDPAFPTLDSFDPLGLLPRSIDLGFDRSVGRFFYGSGLLGFPFFGNQTSRDVATAANLLSEWGSEGNNPGGFPIPFPFGNPFAPRTQAAGGGAASAPPDSAPPSSPTSGVNKNQEAEDPQRTEESPPSETGDEIVPPDDPSKSEEDPSKKKAKGLPAPRTPGGGSPANTNARFLPVQKNELKGNVPAAILDRIGANPIYRVDSSGSKKAIYVWIDKAAKVHKFFQMSSNNDWQIRQNVGVKKGQTIALNDRY